jgi:hypothetical protein
MENLHEPIIWAIVVVILAFQIISFFNTKSDIKKLKHFFPSAFHIDTSTTNNQKVTTPETTSVIGEDSATPTDSQLEQTQEEVLSEPLSPINNEPESNELWIGMINPATNERTEVEARKAKWYMHRGWDKA